MPSDDPTRIMLDLETLGTEPGCAITEIGAVRFGVGGPTSDVGCSITVDRSLDAVTSLLNATVVLVGLSV